MYVVIAFMSIDMKPCDIMAVAMAFLVCIPIVPRHFTSPRHPQSYIYLSYRCVAFMSTCILQAGQVFVRWLGGAWSSHRQWRSPAACGVYGGLCGGGLVVRPGCEPCSPHRVCDSHNGRHFFSHWLASSFVACGVLYSTADWKHNHEPSMICFFHLAQDQL